MAEKETVIAMRKKWMDAVAQTLEKQMLRRQRQHALYRAWWQEMLREYRKKHPEK